MTKNKIILTQIVHYGGGKSRGRKTTGVKAEAKYASMLALVAMEDLEKIMEVMVIVIATESRNPTVPLPFSPNKNMDRELRCAQSPREYSETLADIWPPVLPTTSTPWSPPSVNEVPLPISLLFR